MAIEDCLADPMGSLVNFGDAREAFLEADHNWGRLLALYKAHPGYFSNAAGRVSIEDAFTPTDGFVWRLHEDIFNGSDWEPCFDMVRNKMTKKRVTNTDEYGLFGVSLVDMANRTAILTEGVSDFMSARMLCPKDNVLGLTTLSGNKVAKSILLNLFDRFLVISDNDISKQAMNKMNTGLRNSLSLGNFLKSNGKSVRVYYPTRKDISDELMMAIRLAL